MSFNRIIRIVNVITKAISSLIDTIKSFGEKIYTNNDYQLIELDSTYRNRNQYPSPSDFVVIYTNSNSGTEISNSLDPVSNAFPIISENTSSFRSSLSTTKICLDDTFINKNVKNLYVNLVICIYNSITMMNEYSTIKSYDNITQEAIINPALSFIPGLKTPYTIRAEYPTFNNLLQGPNTLRTVVLSSNSSSIDNFYNNKYILISNSPSNNIFQYSVIRAYNGITKEVILNPPLTTIPLSGYFFEICEYSYDNAVPFRYSGPIIQATDYSINLLQLSIPNRLLTSYYNGYIINYPYIFVHFYNNNSYSNTTMYGNTPSANLATFKIPIRNLNSNSTLSSIPYSYSNFYTFCNNNIISSQKIKLSLREALRVKITLPNGELLNTYIPDTTSPCKPNPFNQISVLISVKKLS